MTHDAARQTTRRMRGALVAAVLLVAAAVPFHAAAQCPASENLFLFGHSWFRGRHWMRTLQEHQVTIADSVCSLDIAAVSFAGSDTANVTLVATRDGSAMLMRMVRRRKSFMCGLPSLNLETPRALDLTIPPGAPFSLVNHPSFRRDSVLAAVRVAPMLIRAYTIHTATASVTDSTDISLADAGGQQVRAIAGDTDTAGGADSGIWVVGDGGLIRHVPFDGAAWGAEQTYDIAGAASLRCIGEGYVGSDDGSVYVFDGNTFAFDERPLTQPLRAIGRHGAVGDEGAVAVHRDGRWDGYTVGTARFIAYNPIAHGNGSSVELLDTAWQYHLFTYEDIPTTFQATSPPFVHGYINVTPYALSGDSMDLELILADPDSNQSPPHAEIRNAGLDPVDLLVNVQGDTLQRRRPELPSRFGVVQLDNDRVSLALCEDSVILEARILRAAPIFSCTTSYWAPDTFTSRARWIRGDTAVFALGTDTLRIVNDAGTVTAFASARSTCSGATLIITGVSHRPATISLPADIRVTDLALLELFDARGRLLARGRVHDRRVMLAAVDPGCASRVAYARFVLRDGSRFSKSLLWGRW